MSGLIHHIFLTLTFCLFHFWSSGLILNLITTTGDRVSFYYSKYSLISMAIFIMPFKDKDRICNKYGNPMFEHWQQLWNYTLMFNFQ